MSGDDILLRRYADTGAEDAFAEVVRRHVDAVYSAALRRVNGDTHLAQDVTQHVFVALARRAAVVARHPAVIGWLHVATRREAANAVRAERRRRAREQEAFTMNESSADHGDSADWGRIAPLIDAEIDRLDERDRVAVLLRFVDNRTFPEIGAALHLSADAARMRVDRALEKLRGAIARRGATTSVAVLSMTLTSHVVAAAPPALAGAATASALSALASAGPGTSTAILEFMMTSKTGAVVAGAALLIAAGGASYEVQAFATARTSRFRAEQSSLALVSQLAPERRLLAHGAIKLPQPPETSDPSAEANRIPSQHSAVAASDKSASVSAADDPISRGQQFMDRHPEVRTALVEFFDANTNTRFGPLYREFHLTPEEIDRFRRLHREFSGYGQSLGPTEPMLQFSANSGVSPEQVDFQLKQLLGDERYKRLQQYSGESVAREAAESVASALTFIEPLTAGQAQQLVSLIAAAKSKQTSGRRDFDWKQVTASTTALLSPAQISVLDGLRIQQEYHSAIEVASAAATTPATIATP